MFQFEIELGSQEVANVDIDAIWEILIPKLVVNKNYGLLIIEHQPIRLFLW
jgi:hypothetical protein